MPKEWGHYKAEIRTLYILQGKTLKEVQRLLKGRHGFKASIRAYRMKLGEWGLKKQRHRSSGPPDGPSTNPQRSQGQLSSTPHESSVAGFSRLIGSESIPHLSVNELASQSHAHIESNWVPNEFPVSNGGDFNGYSFEPQLQNTTSASYLQRSNEVELRDPSLDDSLHAAILHGTKEQVNELLSSGMSVSEWNSKGNQPLHEAIIKGDISIIKLLLKYGPDVNSVGAEGKTPLHLAIQAPEVLGLLFKKRLDVSIQDRAGNTALHLLLQQEKWWSPYEIKKTINNLLSYGADVNITNEDGYSALHLLIGQFEPYSEEKMTILLDILNHGPNISLPMVDKSSPFESLLKKLEPRLRYIGYQRVYRGSTVQKGEVVVGCLEKFLTLGANADTIVKVGSPLLHYFLDDDVFVGRPQLYKFIMLIIQNANVNLAGYDGNSPFHQIICKPSSSFRMSTYSKLDFTRALIDRKADVNQRNTSGACPLELLLSLKDDPVSDVMKHCKALLEAGAVPMLITSKGQSIFELVDRFEDVSGRHKLLKVLLQADLNAVTEPTNLAHHPWTINWRAACKETRWVFAKHLLQFDEPISRPSSNTFLECAYIAVAENILRGHKAQLVLWQAGSLEHEAARHHRQEYVAILNDCNERQADIDPSWYRYLLKILDFA